MRTRLLFLLAFSVATQHGLAAAQSLAGALVGIVKDAQDRVVQGAVVRLTSQGPAGVQTQTTNEKGQLRFAALPPGQYVLDIEAPGFTPYHEEQIRVAAGATLERTVVLHIAGVRESVVVGGSGSQVEARNSGFETRFEFEDLKSIPTRRFSMFDFVRVAPGVSRIAHLARDRIDQQPLGVRVGHQRERVSDRWHKLHLSVQRRGPVGTGRGFHSGGTRPIGRDLRRVRQHPRCGDQCCDEERDRPLYVRRVVLRSGRLHS